MVAVLHSYGPPFNIFFWYPLFPVLSHTDSERTWSLRNVTSLWIRKKIFLFTSPTRLCTDSPGKLSASRMAFEGNLHISIGGMLVDDVSEVLCWTQATHTLTYTNSVDTRKIFFGKLRGRRKGGRRENGKQNFIHLFSELLLPSVSWKNRFFLTRVVVGS